MAVSTRKQNLRIELELTSKGGQLIANVKEADDALGKLEVTTRKTGQTTERTAEETRKYSRSLNQAETSAGNFGRALRTAGQAFGIWQLVELTGQLINASGALGQAQASLELVTGTSGSARAELGFLFEESRRLGTNFLTTAESFSTFAAGVRNSNLTLEETREIFLGVSEATAVLGRSSDDVAGIFRAFTQSISGGRLQLEELNQIAERFPGAFDLANRAVEDLGGNIRELTATGAIAAEDFVLRFARLMREDFAAGVETATQRAGASFNRLFSELQAFGAAAGAVTDFVASLAEGLANLTGWVRETLQGVGILRDLFSGVPGTIEETRAEITRLEAELESLDESMRRSTTAAENSQIFGRQQETLKQLEELRKQLRILEAAAEGAGEGIGGMGDAAANTTGDLRDWNDVLRQSNILLLNSGQQYQALNEALADVEDERIKQRQSDEQKLDALVDELALLQLNREELARVRAETILSNRASEGTIQLYADLLIQIEDLREANTEWTDTITAVGAGFRSLNDDWSDTVSNILDGTAQIIVQFRSLQPLTGNLRRDISGIAGGLGLTSQGIGVGRQVGGRTGGILGGLAAGGLAGFQLGGNPVAAIAGALVGGVLGLLGGGGGGGRDPRNQLFLRQLPFGGQPFSLEPRGDFRVSGQGAFGGFRISGGSEIDQQFIQGLRQVGFAIAEIDDAIGANLDPGQITAVTEALSGFEFGGRAGGAESIEQALRERFTVVFGAIEEGLGEFFEAATGGASADEIFAVANALNAVLGGEGAFTDVEGALAEVNVLMDDFARAGETLPDVLARVNAELGILAAAGVDVTDPTTGLAALASDLVTALGGFDAAVDAVSRFNAVFGQTVSGLENTAETLREDLVDAFAAIDSTLDPFSVTLDDFNRAFLAVVDELDVQALANWIAAGNALADYNQVLSQLPQEVEENTDVIEDNTDTVEDHTEVVQEDTDTLEDNNRAREEQIRINEQILADMERELGIREDLTDSISGLFTILDETTIQTVRRTADELTRAVLGFDDTVEGLQAIREAGQAWRQAALAILNDIESARQTIESSVRQSAQALRLETLTQDQQYEFFRQQAEALAASLDTLDDPEEIARVVAEIDRLAGAALGVADEGQRDQIRREFIDFLDDVGDIADRRLQEIEQDVLATGDQFQQTVVPLIESSFQAFADSVDDFREASERFASDTEIIEQGAEISQEAAFLQRQAADLNLEAARQPVQVVINEPANNAG